MSQIKASNGVITNEKRSYDSFGRLAAIENDGNQSLSYEYNIRARIAKQRVNGVDIVFDYDELGRLKTKILGSVATPISKIEYFYGENRQIAAREVNGIKQEYSYDLLGQLLSVTVGGSILEQYKYDLVGNMLNKTVNGKITTYEYDASNQLASSTVDGKTTTYQYDAAGRMIKDGNTAYSYNFVNKVVKSGENTYNYYASGQIADASYAGGEKEDFTWDGLALLQRNSTNYLNEPYVTGGNPVLAGENVLFNDMLGTTQGRIAKNDKYQAINKTAFGDDNKEGFFTGKPHVEGLGSVFLFRNYRPDQAKWTSSDPIGYPDGWNNLAYVNNNVTDCIDWLGADIVICREVVNGIVLHQWLEVHRNSEITAAAGFYPVSSSYPVYVPGVVKMGTNESHIRDTSKDVVAVYRTTAAQEKAFIGAMIDSYVTNPPNYTLLPFINYACYSFTDDMQAIIHDAFDLNNDLSNLTNTELTNLGNDTISNNIVNTSDDLKEMPE